MSFWIRDKDQAGRWHHFAIEVLPLFWLLPLLTVLPVVIFAANFTFAPVRTLLVCFVVSATGAGLVGVAKWSLIRRGVVVSFGSAKMSGVIKVLYRLGWILLLAGTALMLLCVGLVLSHSNPR